MQNKNPQGNFDPIPDSDQELEKYGVWVKAEPQDVVEEPETDHQPLAVEGNASPGTMEDLSDEFEDLVEMQAFDEAETGTFDDLAPLDDEEPSMLELDSEEPESIELSDFGLDNREEATEDEQSFEDVDMDLDLDEALSADTASDNDTVFGSDTPEDSDTEMNLALDDTDLEPMGPDFETGSEEDTSGELLPQMELEKLEMEDEAPAPSFDDVGALEDDLVSSSSSRETFSGDLLQKIAMELSSIKEELVSLRSQLSELKREPSPSRAENEEPEEESSKGGFFDDEDDDTIALTGDELDNILNTADFTVEPPEDLTTPESLDETDIFGIAENVEIPQTPGIDWSGKAQDLLPEDGSYSSNEVSESEGVEESLESGIEAIEGDEALDLDFENEEELSPLEIIPEINVITESPEDTSYLDEEASELSDGFELDASPLEEVPLVEPDLTSLDLDIEIDDAIAAESAEDLPFMESADEDDGELIIDEESEVVSIETGYEEDQVEIEDDNLDSILDLEKADDEIVLSIDGDEQTASFEGDDFTEKMDEVEEAEPLSMDPFEDETISELELHKEGPRQDDGSWASEPEAMPKAAQVEEIEELESPILDVTSEVGMEESIEDLESMDFEDAGLLGTQEVEDLGGEELEDLGGEELEDHGGEEFEALDDEVLEEPGFTDETDTIADLEEVEELSETVDLDVNTMVIEPEQDEEDLQVEALETASASDLSKAPEGLETSGDKDAVPDKLKQDVKSVLLYLDQLLASLPEEKIEEFASSEYYDTYKKLFEDLGLL